MRSSIEVEVRAPATLVFELARNVERWPALLPHYLRVRVLARHPDDSLTAQFVAVRAIVPVLGLGLPVAWRSRVWPTQDPPQLRFVHLGCATDGMDVTWRLMPTDTGCRVAIEHEFRPRLGWWAWLIDRLFVRPIARRTLGTFTAIAEAVAAGLPDDRRAERRSKGPVQPKTRVT